MTRPRTRSLLATLACTAVLGMLAGFLLGQPQAPTPRESTEDARQVAYEVARDVALATDEDVANDETPTVPSCREALEYPTDGACRRYEVTLEDLLENAQEPCTGAAYLRAEDLSCVPESFYDRRPSVALFKPPSERKDLLGDAE